MNKIVIVSGVALLGWYLYKTHQAKQVSSSNVTVAKSGAASAAVYSSTDSQQLDVVPTNYKSASPLYVTPLNAPISDLPVPGIKKTATPKIALPPVYTQPVKPVLINPVAPEGNKLTQTTALSGFGKMIL